MPVSMWFDLDGLHDALGIPALVIARRRPDLSAIRRALLERVPGGLHKWRLMERAGPMESLAGLVVQRKGLSLSEAERLIHQFAINGRIPEPLRSAHSMIALGQSTHRVKEDNDLNTVIHQLLHIGRLNSRVITPGDVPLAMGSIHKSHDDAPGGNTL